MTRIREAILVEGRYDVNTVRQVVDTVVLESGGFRIFNNKDQLKLLRRIAETRGLIVLTDSDGAGFVIRNYLKGALPKGCVKQAYVPDIAGKERRKRHGSKEEGKLGVEGMRPQVIPGCAPPSGCNLCTADEKAKRWCILSSPSRRIFTSGDCPAQTDSTAPPRCRATPICPAHDGTALLEFIVTLLASQRAGRRKSFTVRGEKLEEYFRYRMI